MKSDLTYQTKKIDLKDYTIQTYTFGKGNKIILAYASFPHSGVYYRWLFSKQKLDNIKFLTFDIPGWIGESKLKNKKVKIDLLAIVNIAEQIASAYNKPIYGLFGYSFGVPLAIKTMADIISIKKLIIVSGFINTVKYKARYHFWLNLFNRLNFFSLTKKYIQYRFWQYRKTIKESGDSGFLDHYEYLISQCNSKIIFDTGMEIIKLDWSKYLKKIKNRKVLVVNSRKEPAFFSKQARLMRINLKKENSIFLSGGHADFLVHPNHEALAKIINFYNTDNI